MFCDSEVGGGSGGVNVIYSQPGVADDIISGDNVQCRHVPVLCFVNLWVAIFSASGEAATETR